MDRHSFYFDLYFLWLCLLFLWKDYLKNTIFEGRFYIITVDFNRQSNGSREIAKAPLTGIIVLLFHLFPFFYFALQGERIFCDSKVYVFSGYPGKLCPYYDLIFSVKHLDVWHDNTLTRLCSPSTSSPHWGEEFIEKSIHVSSHVLKFF